MNLAWASAAFSYFLVGYYMKYIPGDIYVNNIYGGIIELIACVLIAGISHKFGSKSAIILSFLLSFSSCIFLTGILIDDEKTE